MRSPVLRFFVTTLVSFTFIVNVMAQSKGFDTSRMDRSADACDDFFQYANGTWLKNTEIPASQSRWGSFNILADNNREVLRTVLEEAAAKKNAAKGSDEQLIGDYYSSCMNEAAIEQAGIKPLENTFSEIEKMRNAADVQAQIARLHSLGVGVVFGFGSGQDLKNSSQMIANAGQGGLSLPNSDYYTKNDPKSVETRQKFVEYAETMFKLIGEPEAKAAESAKTVMEVQMRLANASLPPVEMRNPENRYNKISINDAQKVTPDLSWASYVAARGVGPLTEINLGQPAFFREVNTMIREMPIDKWKTYFRFMVVNSSASRLPKRFVDANFEFFGKYLSGTKEQEPRWKRCVSATDGALGEALGMEFVKRAFKPEAKKRMDELISNLFVAMKERIDALPWMSSETKTKAQGKLATIKRKIGYPDVLRGYKGLDIDRGSFLLNARRSGQFQIKRNLDDIGKPVDRTRWGMTPPTVNAYYSGTFNEIVFPAGILQPPFFNAAADDAINYGAIGGVIGHEISHGFDDQGSKFDAEGNLRSWWTDSDRQKFEERAACVVEQFNGYEVQPGLRINGRLTLGENIGDLGGLNIAYTAFRHSLDGKARPADIDGFTPEQRFFLGWAQVWATKATAEFERQQVLSDSHSAARYRVNGPISNMPEFAKAFGCRAPAKMIRNDACIIW